ncbi:MAG: PilZ domain-containing protein [Planctomycetota bacterium]|jgi:hypothetical protein
MSTPARERRRAPRAFADFPIQLSTGQVSPNQGVTEGRLKDLSAIGLCCTTKAEVAEFTKLGIDLQLPGHSRRHTIQGAVVRSEPSRTEKGTFEIAVYFTEIEPATKLAIGEFVAGGEPA